MKFVKLLVAGGGLLLLLVIAALLIVFVAVDGIAKSAIERGGSSMLGVETTVEGADVGLLSGTFAMQGFNVGNPDGYPSPHFLDLEDANVALTLGSLFEDTVRLPELRIGKIDLYLDRTGGTANYQRILDNVAKRESGEPAPDGTPAEPGKGYVIDVITLAPATVHVTGLPGLTAAAGDITVSLPEIKLENVGSKEPMQMSELIALVVKTLLSATVEAGGGVIPPEMLGELRTRLSTLTGLDELGIDAVGDVGAIAGSVQQRLDEEIEGARDRLDEELDGAKEQLDDAVKDLGDRFLGGGGRGGDDGG